MVDADGDGYPARHLSSCSPEDQAPYCFSDTCPTVFNMPQSDTSACTFLETSMYRQCERAEQLKPHSVLEGRGGEGRGGRR